MEIISRAKSRKVQKLKIGDHIKVSRLGYEHQGIYVGNSSVIHFSGEPGQKRMACIQLASIDDFLAGGELLVVRYMIPTFSPQQVVANAYYCLGIRGYDVAFNNCEHFATLCKTGRKRSSQVLRGIAISSVCIAANLTNGPIAVFISALAGPAVELISTGLLKMDLDLLKFTYPAVIDLEEEDKDLESNGTVNKYKEA